MTDIEQACFLMGWMRQDGDWYLPEPNALEFHDLASRDFSLTDSGLRAIEDVLLDAGLRPYKLDGDFGWDGLKNTYATREAAAIAALIALRGQP